MWYIGNSSALFFFFFFFNDTAPAEIYTLSLHDALPICCSARSCWVCSWGCSTSRCTWCRWRSEEHTSELQSRPHLVCRLLLEKKKNNTHRNYTLRPQQSLPTLCTTAIQPSTPHRSPAGP